MKRLFPFLLAALLAAAPAFARDFSSRIISPTNAFCRAPAGDVDFVVWEQHSLDNGTVSGSDIVLWTPSAGVSNLTALMPELIGLAQAPAVSGRSIAFTASFPPTAPSGPEFKLAFPELSPEMAAMQDEYPTLFGKPAPVAETTPAPEDAETEAAPGEPETSQPRVAAGANWRSGKGSGTSIALWENGAFTRITPANVGCHLPVVSDSAVVALCTRGWPYGYELLAWDRASSTLSQLTTNFFYVQSPRLSGSKLVYQSWDGNDNEIFLLDLASGELTQITDNTFDDSDPDIDGDTVAWVAHPVTTGEIFAWTDGVMRKLSQNSIENACPRVWNGRVVWQGVPSDGDTFDIFYNDGSRTVKLTSNIWDDRNPVIGHGIVAWESYVDLADAEIMALDLSDNIPVQLSSDFYADHSPVICGEAVVWQTDTGEASYIQLATPTSPRAEPKTGDAPAAE